MSRRPAPQKHKSQKHQHTAVRKNEPAATGWQHNRLLLLVLVLTATFVAFLPSLSNEFIGTWDDGVYITDNTSIMNLSWENIRYFFTNSKNGTYVPLPLLSFALEYHFFALDPFPYHINNLILHLICTALAFRLFLLLRLPAPYAAMAALLFGIHPMRVETVAWVTERKDLLFSVFYLAAIITYIRFIQAEKGRAKFFIWTLLFFVLSLFSKIQAVTLPLSLLLIDYYLDRKLSIKLVLEKIPFFVLSLAFGIFGLFVLKNSGTLEVNESFTLFQRIFFGSFALCAYLIKFIAPINLSAFYPYPVQPGETLPVIYYLSPVFLGIVAALVYLSSKKTKAVVFGTMFFLVNVMFLLQILGAGQAFQADRFTYIPYLGLFFLTGWGLHQLAIKNPSAQLITLGLAGTFVVFLITQTYSRCKVWKDSLTLWTDVIEKYPGRIPTAYANRASAYRQLQQTDLALQDYNYSIKLDSTEGTSRMNRGNIYFDLNKDDLALKDYYAALSLNLQKNQEQSQIHKLYCNLGSIYGRRGVLDSSIYYLEKSLAIDSTFADAWLNHALAISALGNWKMAISDYERYLRYFPEDADIHSDIGVCYQNLNDYNESILWFNKAIFLNPGNGLYLLNRSFSYNALNKPENAKQDAIQARNAGTAIPPSYAQSLGL